MSEVKSMAVTSNVLLDEVLFCQVPNIYGDLLSRDYREPNECGPNHIKPHLALMEKGWIVSVGSERSFFDILLSPEEQCEGLIILDIDPRIKAYCDFLILLLRMST